MKYFSMFSGIGGFELGIQRAFDNRQAADNQREGSKNISKPSPNPKLNNVERPISCGYSEIDKYADQIYQKHFGGRNEYQESRQSIQRSERGSVRPVRDKSNTTKRSNKQPQTRRDREFQQPKDNHQAPKNYGDATTINARELPDFDLLVGGFPCQAFSVAGKRLGFNETRGTLFFDIARILKEKRPRHLVLENVKGLLSHDQGKTFQTILGVLADLGYFVEWQVLNSKDFGVPQNRERVFIVGHLGGEPSRKVFPITGTNEKDTSPRQISTTINSGGGGQGAKTGLYAVRQPLRYLNRNQRNIEGDYSYTVDSTNTGGIATATRIRRLTPLECERLQGFPDNWTEYGVVESNPGIDNTPMKVRISDTQRYKTLGNAVTVNVVQAVITNLGNQ